MRIRGRDGQRRGIRLLLLLRRRRRRSGIDKGRRARDAVGREIRRAGVAAGAVEVGCWRRPVVVVVVAGLVLSEPLEPGFAAVAGLRGGEVGEEGGRVEGDGGGAGRAAVEGMGGEGEGGVGEGAGVEEAGGEAEEGVVVGVPEGGEEGAVVEGAAVVDGDGEHGGGARGSGEG